MPHPVNMSNCIERKVNMETLAEQFGGAYSSYNGEKGNWQVAYSVARDDDLVYVSNFEVMETILTELDPSNVDVERARHWACGWIDYLIVAPNSKASKKAEELLEDLSNYPLLDDMHYYKLEAEREREYADLS
jgi:hypothetical protein